MKKSIAGLAAALAVLTGCGSDSASTDAPSTEAAVAESVAAETVAVETVAAETVAAAASDAGAAPAAAANTYTLKEWSLEGPATLAAGPVDISVVNGGSFPHELVIIKGDYASLPKDDIGSVLEDQLPAGAVITEVERFGAGESKTASVTLEAGVYTFLCNISVGPNSHAGKGQVLDVTVA